MPDEPQWPTDDDDADLNEPLAEPTVQVSRPSLDQPTMRFPVAAVLKPPSTPEAPRSSPVRSAPNGAAAAAGGTTVPLNGSGGLPASPGGSSGGKSHGQVGPDGGQPAEPPRAAPVRITPGDHGKPAPVVEPKNDQTRVVPKPEQKTTELSVPPGKTARVDQLSEKSWFDQPVRTEAPAPRPQPPRVEPVLPPPPPPPPPPAPKEEPVRETLPVSGYDEEPQDRLTGSDEPKKGRKPLAVVLGLLVVAALAGASIYAVNEFGGPAAIQTKPPAAPANVQPLVKAATAGAPAATAAGVRAALAGPAGNSALGTLNGTVVDPASGAVLWQQGDTTPSTPASSLKILTAAAALLSLEKTDQLSTKVVQGAEPGTVVIVGGGDPTISGTPGSSVYPGAATLDDLVNQVKQKGVVTKVQFDLSRYAGEALGPQWESADIAGGSVAPIVPFMIDGGRFDPKKDVSARTGSPAQSAADAFAQRIGAPGATIGTAPPGAQVLGEIKSAPIEQLVDNMMQISDNVLTEAIAREIAIKSGNEPSFTGGVKAVRDVLTKNGFDLTGANFVDGSGLSATNKLPAKLLTDVLTTAAKPTLDDPRTAKLRPLLTALPVAGGSGTLAGRYAGSAAGGKGWVRAKTGTLTGVNALAGMVVDVDGRVLVFAFMSASNRNPETEVRPALDVMAAALRGCGCS
ncbi:D-alanyl-D-alanine carboxypeptidase/D-alanyl-D-alanine endopeptidase [Lentzea terrae]|uniref:D-alanyl-D-alanine carboxypeptidase/D-alanyl-D-alanine endopeptidase n=1 Tax=Lentzea terrae TaxID=2200761 RepID=UPI000DD40E81|nr:D-alanyl-D-alanine carboxypeptidase/D-alanyl-D-alanine-endopeptidase [Lentzea terrae]